MMGLQNDIVDHRSDDIADVVGMGARAERYVGRDRAREIFFGKSFDPAHSLELQGIANIDLMAGHPNVHLR